MALKHFNPTTSGQRQLVIVDRSGLYKGKPVKTLTEGLLSKGGVIIPVKLLLVFKGGDISVVIDLLILSVSNLMYLQRLSVWNMIQIVQRSLH